ncbi:MAG TPA: DUF3857 domain-containing protein [Cyclobacteriaceae bacterium]|nr:DUF3857 domain-containing protein [Cyclobacteriaceae bacterium]
MRFFLGLFLLTSHTLVAQSYQVKVLPPSGWVKPVTFEGIHANDTSGTSGGYYDLLSDEQVNSASRESYYHAAQQVISEKGLENISTLSRSFDPSYQNLAVHFINVYRNGRKINQLSMGKFEVIRRETSMDRSIYDKSLTAIFQIQDLQVGDVLEYAWTVTGTNPVFGDHTSRYFYFNYAMPIGRISVRFITSAAKKFELRSFNHPPAPQITEDHGYKVYEWSLDQVPALLSEESTPGWHDPYQHVQIGDYGSWHEVAVWGAALFKKPDERLLDRIEGIQGLPRDKAIVRLIEFVQDEIRYLSLSDGIHGYKPHLPSDVLRQRFGDCKDKSFLLVSLLNELGVKSQPVLVDTRSGKTLPDYLPSPYFDHCIVRFEIQDSIYWIDPTISLQRGILSKRTVPNYYFGLVLDPDFRSLVPMPEATTSKTITHEVFDLDRVGGNANLTVTTTYSGSAADNVRSYFGSNSKEEISRQYLNFYAGDYQDISLKGPITWSDDATNNVIVSHEAYQIASFWEYDSMKNEYKVEIYPRSMAGLLAKPNTILRKNPFSISHPLDFTQEIDLKMPEPWNVETLVREVESPAFTYRSKVNYKEEDVIIELTHHYQSLKSSINPDEIKNHVNRLEEINDHLTFSITYNDERSSSQAAFNYPYLIILFVVVGLTIFFLMRAHRWDPEVQISSEQYAQIGGWLILPAFGICVTPFIMIFQIFAESDGIYFIYSTWSGLFSDSSRLYTYVLAEFVLNVGLITYTCYLAWLMFQRRTSVPYLFIGYYVFNLLLQGADLMVANWLDLNAESETYSTLSRAIIAAVIWIPYFLIAQRPKGTFTVRYRQPNH